MGDVEVVAEFGKGMLTSPWWNEFAASAGTVFHTSRFLLPWWEDRQAKSPDSRLVTIGVFDADGVVGLCAFELDAGVLSFAGGLDVVDYMGPIAAAGREKEVAAALGEWMFEGLPWDRAHLAGLAGDAAAADSMVDEILRRAPSAVAETYDQAPRIEKAPDGYLRSLNSKRRADVLRKRNRLIEAVGQLELVVSTPETTLDLLERLLSWKACASAATGEFVAAYGDFLRKMLSGLTAADAGHVVELRASGRPLASAIMLRHRDTAYIYNMSYDTSLTVESSLAPGVVLVSLLVERSLDSGLRFDFLKGAQDYKLRLGGVPVDLTAVTVER
ncbi:GNAT family N-acetyltransferase [Actinocrinis sp.]|uniref:GNAT family N-acetyltransferase n=1 Tax=Actinocrinis sp. TaxID=1920516 RepID=UPI002D7A280F|nr:GNAT family N-acetyltransferase [Actinocrinis sp.]